MNMAAVEKLRENPRDVYDYIVIGAGSAGCVVAARLSENPDIQVLLLEAGGPDTHEAVENPVKWPTLLGGDLDWGYQTVPQCHAANRVIPCPRGKMLGGCHSHNASAWVRGHRTDFDHWAYQGNPGGDFKSILPIYQKIEDYAGGANAYRGAGGPLYMELPKDPNPLAQAFLEAGRDIGLPVVEDNNAAEMEGVSHFNLTIKNGKRYSVARTYLYPAMQRPNLTVLMYAETRRLVCEGTRCRGSNTPYRERSRRRELSGKLFSVPGPSVRHVCCSSQALVQQRTWSGWAFRSSSTCRAWGGTCRTMSCWPAFSTKSKGTCRRPRTTAARALCGGSPIQSCSVRIYNP